MKRRSPTLEGFQAMFRLPSLGLAEIAWRWSFGLAVAASLAFSFREYMATLPVTAGEMLLLRTRQPTLILQAIARIFQGSGPRAVAALIVLTLALVLAWIMLASLGRAATLNALCEYFRESRGRYGHERLSREADTPMEPAESQEGTENRRMTPLIGLNFFRAVTTLVAVVGSVGAILLAGAASSTKDPSPGSALLIFYMLTMFIAVAWMLLNWFLSLAAVFIGDVRDTYGALGAAADLCWSRPGSVLAATTWFGLAHVLAFVGASSVAALPLAFVGVLPGGVVLGGLLLIALLYFAVVDFLYVGRLAALVFMTKVPETPVPDSRRPSALGIQPLAPRSDDDILSDIPGLVAPPKTAGG